MVLPGTRSGSQALLQTRLGPHSTSQKRPHFRENFNTRRHRETRTSRHNSTKNSSITITLLSFAQSASEILQQLSILSVGWRSTTICTTQAQQHLIMHIGARNASSITRDHCLYEIDVHALFLNSRNRPLLVHGRRTALCLLLRIVHL